MASRLRFSTSALAGAAVLYAAVRVMAPVHGLAGEYYLGPERSGTPALTTIDREPSTERIAKRWVGAAPSTFTVRWLGYLTIDAPGQYAFALTSDDGGALSIDGVEVIDDRGRHPPHTQVQIIQLQRGAHLVEIEHQQAGGGYLLDWQWSKDGAPLRPVPAWRLTPERHGVNRVVAFAWARWAAAALAVLAAVLAAPWLASLVKRLMRRPKWAALVLFAVLAVAHTWPMATDLAHLSRHDNRDTLLNQWILGWVAHQAVADPVHLFQGNIFYPERDTLAYSEAMLVQAAMGAPLLWAGASPVLVYNLLVLVGMALSAWTLSLVVQRWTGDWAAGLVAGAAAGFSAHTLTRLPHLQAQHVEFLPLALLALDGVLRQPSARQALRLALWSVLQAFTSVYLLVFTVFAIGAALIVRPREWLGSRAWPAVRALTLTALVAGAALLPFLLPYYRVSQEQGLVRSLGDAAQYAATFSDYLTTPARVHLWWSLEHRGTTGLFPGALALILAIAAVARGTAFTDSRARMALAIAAVGFAFSFGPAMPGYAALFDVLPLLQAIRATARFGYLTTLGVAILAGFGLAALRSAWPARAWMPAATAVLVSIAALEPLAAPLGLSRFDGIAPVYARIPREPGTVVVEMPFFGPRSVQFHAHYMLNSTKHWQPIVNGYSGFQPPSFYEHAGVLQGFPDDASFAMLRDLRVTHVVVHRSQLTPEQLAGVDAQRQLTLVDSFGETEVYRLSANPP